MKGKLLNITASISFLFCVSLTPINSNAATHVVNSPDDASLRAAIAQGGWIGFGFSGTVTLTNTIPITTHVFLDGSGVAVTISGGSAVRLFSVAPGVTFGVTNLTLANGTCLVTNNQAGVSADGGAINNTGGNVTLVSCTLTNNNALCRAAGGIARGGAIFSDGGTVSLFQTSVSNNLAIAGGQFTLSPSPFNTTALGGAIYSANAAVTITGCTISSNLCQALYQDYGQSGYMTMGGAAFQASGAMTIEGSVFASNQALGGRGGTSLDVYTRPAHGGALAATAGSVTINHSLLVANTAQGGTGSYHSSGGFAYGGAVYSAAILAVRDTALVANQAVGGACGAPNPYITPANGYGGAIYNSGTAALSGCSVYSNAAVGGAGAMSPVYGPVTGGVGSGGAIYNAAQLGATNCTLALNSTSGGAGQGWNSYLQGTSGNAFGGGVFNNTNATFAAMNLTIASNTCTSPFGDLFTNGVTAGFQIANTNGTLRLHNSLIAYSGTNANAYGTITDDGYNICSDGSAQLFGGASYNFTDPKLGPLGDYGGPTWCMALLAGSPAIDTGDPAQSPSTDQRGLVRPAGPGPDIGAYETSAPATRYTLDVSVDGSGIVTKNPTNSVYPPGVTVTVTAAPNGGWYFDHWSGGASGSANPLNLTMNTNLAITAHFLAFPYTISLQTNGQGTIALNPPWGTYPQGAAVTLTAAPNDRWYFDHWSGDASGSTNPLQVTISTSLAITAHFLAFPCTVTLQTNGQGAIALNPPGGGYFSNSLVTVTATPVTGWTFDSWSGAISSKTNPMSLTVNSNVSLTGTFRQLPCVAPPSGLVGWWRGEGDGNDASGNNNTGTLSGGVSLAPGKVGQAFSFEPFYPDPSNSGTLVILDSPSLRLTTQLTIEAWINPRSTNGDQSIVAKVGGPYGAFDNNGYQFLLSGNSLVGQFNSLGQGWPSYRIQCALPVATGTWCHAAWTYDQSAMKLYWNGQSVATNVIGAQPIAAWRSRLHISGDDGVNAFFFGLIDEPSVYNRALSDSEVAAIYNAGGGGKCTRQQVRPSLSILPTPSNVVVSYPASPTNLYCLQASTNLLNWTDLSTNGPFAGLTNVIQAFGLQGFKSRYFRVRME